MIARQPEDVEELVRALFTLIGGIQRATRRSGRARALELLETVRGVEQARLSDLAEHRQVHPSLITRQVRELEALGFVEVIEDPGDRRAWLVTLTPAGVTEAYRLRDIGLARFALFVAGWEPEEVQTLTALLDKLNRSRADVAAREHRELPFARRSRSTTTSRPRPHARKSTQKE